MKKIRLKNWMVALTLIMGVSLTSCLDSDEVEMPYDGRGLARVKGDILSSYYMQDVLGNKYYPTSASLSQMEISYGFKPAETNLCFFTYKDVEVEGAQGKASEKTVQLVSAQSMDGPDVILATDAEQMEQMAPETAPVVTAAYTDGSNTIKPALFDLETLVMFPAWNLSANDEKAFKKHKLNLVCLQSEMEQGDTDLVFYLRHDRGEDKEGGMVYYYNWYGYDIQAAVNIFAMKTGNQPTRLIVKAKENGPGATELPKEYTEYIVEYKLEHQQ